MTSGTILHRKHLLQYTRENPDVCIISYQLSLEIYKMFLRINQS